MKKTHEDVLEDLLEGRSTGALKLQSPHDKPFMPGRLGRMLDRVSYRDWLGCTTVLFALAVALLAWAPDGHGLRSSEKNISDVPSVLYFCLITFTTVGYGDIVPVGAARIVAAIMAVYGVTSLAFLIGKLASERSQATLFLLHTSDRERRLKIFSADLQHARRDALVAISLERASELRRTTRQLVTLLEAISNYVVFHVHQVDMGHIGNAPAMSRLIQDLAETVMICPRILAVAVDDSVVVRRSWVLASRLEGLVCFLVAAGLQTEEDVSSTLVRFARRTPRAVAPLGAGQRALLSKLRQDLREFRDTFRSRPNAALLDDVLKECSSARVSEMKKNFYKDIAKSLGISVNVTKRCIDTLLEQGRLVI
jgi:hypothetical protein